MLIHNAKILFVIVITIIAGCSSSSSYIEMEPNQIVYTKDYEEVLLDTFVKDNHYVAYICIDASCSSCMTELQWWYKFIEEHKLLSPVFVINYSYSSIQPFVKYVRNIIQIEYPVLQGEKYGPIDTTYPKKGEGKLTRGICPVCAYDFSTPAESEN